MDGVGGLDELDGADPVAVFDLLAQTRVDLVPLVGAAQVTLACGRRTPSTCVNQSASGSDRNTRSTSTTSVPACGQPGHGRGAHPGDLGVDLPSPRRRPHHPGRQPEILESAGPRRLGRGQRERIGGIGTDAHVEGIDQVPDPAGHRAPHAQAHRARRPHPADRDAAVRRLEAGEAAQRGRDADRPATIAARGQRHHPRSQRGRRTTRGTTRRTPRVPGVAGGALDQAGGVALIAELGRGRLAQHHTARGPQARHQRRVGGRRRILGVQQRAEAGGEAGRVLQVLDADRDAGERSHGLARRDPRASIAAASANARSASTTTQAFSCGSRASMRPSAWVTSSTAGCAPLATPAASSANPVRRRSIGGD